MPENNRPKLNIPLLDSEAGQAAVRKICEEHGVREKDLYDLLESQIQNPDGVRRTRLFSDFDSVFGDGDAGAEKA